MKYVRVTMLRSRDQLQAPFAYNLPRDFADTLVERGDAVMAATGPSEVKPAGPSEFKPSSPGEFKEPFDSKTGKRKKF